MLKYNFLRNSLRNSKQKQDLIFPCVTDCFQIQPNYKIFHFPNTSLNRLEKFPYSFQIVLNNIFNHFEILNFGNCEMLKYNFSRILFAKLRNSKQKKDLIVPCITDCFQNTVKLQNF